MVRRFDARQDITPGVLSDLLESLDASPCRHLQRSGLFAERELDFEGEQELIVKILSDLEYQEQIARAALKLREAGDSLPGVISYHWEIGADAVGMDYRQKYASIDLVLEPADPDQSRVQLPALVVKCRQGGFKYWGVMNIDDALGTVRLLLGS